VDIPVINLNLKKKELQEENLDGGDKVGPRKSIATN